MPVTADLESGYGDSPQAVGCTLEDNFPADGKLRSITDQCERVRHSRKIADAANVRFFNARTDVFFQSPVEQHNASMLDEAIARATAYAEAGADGIFAPGLAEIGLIARLAEASPLPLNVMVGDTTPPEHVLAEHGIPRVSYGPRPYR
jgi:2-methylisocitrate lyase-like PEP mutase family enzyme